MKVSKNSYDQVEAKGNPVPAPSKSTTPDLKNYLLRSLSIDPAENGVIVSCEYRIKPDVRAALSKRRDTYVDTWIDPKKHVFKDYEEAGEFISKQMKSMTTGSGKKS